MARLDQSEYNTVSNHVFEVHRKIYVYSALYLANMNLVSLVIDMYPFSVRHSETITLESIKYKTELLEFFQSTYN